MSVRKRSATGRKNRCDSPNWSVDMKNISTLLYTRGLSQIFRRVAWDLLRGKIYFIVVMRNLSKDCRE